jgi:hypothetical protein
MRLLSTLLFACFLGATNAYVSIPFQLEAIKDDGGRLVATVKVGSPGKHRIFSTDDFKSFQFKKQNCSSLLTPSTIRVRHSLTKRNAKMEILF